MGFDLLHATALIFEVEVRLDEICAGPREHFDTARQELIYDAMIEFLKRAPSRSDVDEVFQDIIEVIWNAEYAESNISDEMREKYGRGDW